MNFKVKISNNEFGFGTEYRKNTEKQEANVGKWLDKFVYPYIFKEYARNTDKDTQIAGVDVYVTGNTIAFTVDEKATIDWCNCNLTVYSMELSSLGKSTTGEEYEVTGWFFTATGATFTELVFIDNASTVKADNPKHLDGSGITEATIIFLDKAKFQQGLDRLGWTKDNITKKAKLIREAHKEYGEEYWKHINCGNLRTDGYRFYVEQSKQHSINLQFTRNFLIDNAALVCTFKEGKLTWKKN